MRLIPLSPYAVPAALGLAVVALAACQPTEAPAPAPLASATPCAIPADLTPAVPYDIPEADRVTDVAPAFNMLAVSWSPEACRSGKDYPDPVHQCAQNQFGLTLHGLWPNGPDRRHPRYCAAPGPAVKLETVRQHFCMTPSPTLIQHEWAAHGTCGWDTPEAYFADAARLWNGLNRPNLEAIPADHFTAGAIRDAFAAANPDLPRTAVYVSATDGWFREVRLCYSNAYQEMPCPSGLGVPDEVVLKLAQRGVQTAS